MQKMANFQINEIKIFDIGFGIGFFTFVAKRPLTNKERGELEKYLTSKFQEKGILFDGPLEVISKASQDKNLYTIQVPTGACDNTGDGASTS